jgi:hypothetical protein
MASAHDLPAATMLSVPFEPERWAWTAGTQTPAEHLGRECLFVDASEAGALGTVAGVELADGVVEVELALGRERGFHGVIWRVRDDENYESFFVRPHQVGNPDAVQYTPVCNGISSWQLYHGPGYWAPVSFPIDEWFRIRVVFAGDRAEVYVGDLSEPALAIHELKLPAGPGRVGVMVGGPGIHLSGFAYDSSSGPVLRSEAQPPERRPAGVVPAWWVSDAFPEPAIDSSPSLDADLLEGRSWTRLASEPAGLVDLAWANGIRDGRNTVLARTTVRSEQAQVKRLELGFSDRAVVYLNGRAHYRGDDTYRSRDYRFLGSIGYWDTLYLPLVQGENELVVAVSEDFGGWGIQGRFAEPDGLSFGEPAS